MKKIYGLTLTALFLCFTTVAQISVWDGTNTVWINGSGTVAQPYLIESAAHLAHLAVYVNNGTGANPERIVGENTFWKLTTNIDFNSRSWTPIGNNLAFDEGYFFGGHFDGNEYTIANLATDGDLYYAGLFGSMKGGSVKNTGIIGTSSIASNRAFDAGAIAGKAENVTITNCYNTGNIVHEKLVWFGGIIGTGNDLTISNCYNTGNISTSTLNPYAGGIIGNAGMNTTINNCYNTGSISSVDGTAPYVAGIVATGGSGLTINNCYNTGNVSSQGQAAGISGWSGFINNCYNTGTIFSSYHVEIYSVAIARNANVNNSYYLEGSASEAGDGIAKSTEEMKTQAFVDLLNSGPVPNNAYTRDITPVNDGFPILKWQTGEVGILENVLSNISVYPNPVREQLTITTEQVLLSDYSIYSITGQLMLQGKLLNETTTINVESLPTGIYCLRLAEKTVKILKL